jgi:putative hydrolase of HD superfamily
MALIHDLAESVVGDFTPSDDQTPEEKHRLEVEAFTTICADIDNGSELLELLHEYEKGESPEAQFVRRLDKLEMMFQAYKYRKDQPHVNLQEFWDYIQKFDFGSLRDTYDNLLSLHKSF